MKFYVYLYNLLFSFLFTASTKIIYYVTSHFAAIYCPNLEARSVYLYDITVLYKCLQDKQDSHVYVYLPGLKQVPGLRNLKQPINLV